MYCCKLKRRITAKKRIEEAAGKRSFKYLSQDRIEELELGCHYEAGFIAGAEYVLSHQWISVYEALPEDEEHVIALIAGAPVIANGIHVKEHLKDIIAWMPIPKFETKDKK